MDRLSQPKPGKFQLACSIFVTYLAKTLKDEFWGKFILPLCMAKHQILLPSIYYSQFALPYGLGVLEENIIKPNTKCTQDKGRPRSKRAYSSAHLGE